MSRFEKLITLVEVSDGPQGPAGPSGESYRLEANVEKIIQYKSTEVTGGYKISPEKITFSLLKETVLQELSEGNFRLKCYNVNSSLSVSSLLLKRLGLSTLQHFNLKLPSDNS